MGKKRITIIICFTTLLVLLSLFLAGSISAGRVEVNFIQPDTTRLDPPTTLVTHTFPFEKGNVTISVPVNNSVYWGAKFTNKSVKTYGDVPLKVWTSKSFHAMIFDPAQDELYNDLLTQFRDIRTSQNLSDDEYAELLAAYAQSLTYKAIDDNPAKYPVETVYDKEGDCDDKSLLLAGLLSREGYKVALLLFENDKHVVVGIGSDDNLYLDSGYAYVDIMDYSFVGIPVNKLRGAKKMYLDPIAVPIGSGTKLYHSGDETHFISDMAVFADNRSGTLALQMKEIPLDTAENISLYEQTRKEFYNYSAIYTYVIHNRFDRPGVYEYLKREMPV
ncbi:MAG: hypothetical protein M0Q92_06085 [Methanoregula sp.]|jgi:hypothetical protein|nr:hypothetical protein [Methanoregula sp.]